MKKTILGIIFFLFQISLAIFYNGTIDLKIIIGISSLTFVYILYNYVTKKYVNFNTEITDKAETVPLE